MRVGMPRIESFVSRRFDYVFLGYQKEPCIVKCRSGIAGMALSAGRPDRIRELKAVHA